MPDNDSIVKFCHISMRTSQRFLLQETRIGDTTSAYQTIIAQWGGKNHVMHYASKHRRTRLGIGISLLLLLLIAVFRPAMAAAPALSVTVHWDSLNSDTAFRLAVDDASADQSDLAWQNHCSVSSNCTVLYSKGGSLNYTLSEALPGRYYHVIVDHDKIRDGDAKASVSVAVNGILVAQAFCTCSNIGLDRDGGIVLEQSFVPNPETPKPYFTIVPDNYRVWANGHQETKLTVREVDANGQGVPNRTIHLEAVDDQGNVVPNVKIMPANSTAASNPINGQTGSQGEDAVFTATSTDAIPVKFIATDAQDSNLTDSTVVEFQRRKIVVQFLGITTNLQCNVQTGQCIPNIPRDPWDNTFETIRTALINTYHFKEDDFLWYSYNGGSVDHASGKWQPKGYECQDTAQAYDISIFQLRLLINQFGNDNPNTDFYLVGHSQGGLIAFQELGFLNERPAKTSIGAIITLDSPLGGMPKFRVKAKQWTDCWDNGRAPDQLVQLYNYQVHGQDHDQQGTNAHILCSLHGIDLCSDQTNGQAVQLAPTYTFGSSDDVIYTCFSSTASTQVVNGAAGGGIFPLGGGLLGHCSRQSHSMPFTKLAGVVSDRIGDQIGGP